MNYFSNQHRYNSLDVYLKTKFKAKVFKIALNASLTCPNRDGTISKRGCLFCSDVGSGEYAGHPKESLQQQFKKGQANLHKKWPNGKYIVYFQANTNTYATLSHLKQLFETAINLDPNIVALSIATRCDTLPNDVLDFLAIINQKLPVWIELGLQSSNQDTMDKMNLGYTISTFKNAVQRIKERNIEVIAHIINGLPNETKDVMINTVEFLNNLNINGIKIHSLYLVKNSELGQAYLKQPFPLLTLTNYVDIVCEQLAKLSPNIIIHRINGDPPLDFFIAPNWALKKFVIMNEIDKRMKDLNYYQGCKYEEKAY